MTAASASSGYGSAAPARWLVPGLLGAVLPAIAILFWSREPYLAPALQSARHFGFPVILLELAVILIGLRRNLRAAALLGQLNAPLKALLTVWALAAAASLALHAPDPAYGAIRTLYWPLHIWFGLTIHALAREGGRGFAERVAACLLGGGTVYAVILIAYVATVADAQALEWRRAMPGFSNVRHMGYVMAAFAALSAASMLLARRRGERILSLALYILFWAVLLWSGSRGGAAAVIIGLPVAFLAARTRVGTADVALLVGGALAGAALSLLHQPPSTDFGLFRLTESAGAASVAEFSTGRTRFWIESMKLIAANPLVGYGEGQFQNLVAASGGHFMHPHSIVPQMLLAWGLIGALPAFALIAFAWFKAAAAARAVRPALPGFLMGSVLLALSLIDGTMYHPQPVMLVALGLGLALGLRR